MKVFTRLLSVVVVFTLTTTLVFGQTAAEWQQKLANSQKADYELSVQPVTYNPTANDYTKYVTSDGTKDILWDNGPLVTEPGGGSGGTDYSALQDASLGMGTYGFGGSLSSGYSICDDFDVTGTWTINSITFYAYQTGSGPPSTLNHVAAQVWDGDPTSGGTVIWGDLTTNIMLSTEWTNIWRVLESSPGENRPIMQIVADFGGLSLSDGTYWVEYNVDGTGSSGPWLPPITILGQTTTGNAYQNVGGTYQATEDVGPQGFPFLVEGTTGPGLDPPTDLTATVIDDDVVVLNWTSPGGSPTGEWIQWDAGTNTGNGIGLTAGGTFYVASHWLPAELAAYDGMDVTQLSIFPNADPAATYSLMVWTGPNAGTLVMDQPLASVTVDEFNEINLDSPVTIDASLEYWFGYACTHAGGTFPAGCDDGPAIQYSGDMISLDGTSWVSMGADYGLDYNWNLAAYVVGTDEAGPLTPIVKNYTASSGSFASAGPLSGKFKAFAPASDALQSFNVYRDGGVIGNTTLTTYTDMDLASGTYEYWVTAVYDEGESGDSNHETVVIDAPVPPAIFEDDFEAYNAGEQLACQNPEDWTTWSNNPCSSEDAYVSDTYAYSGEKSVNVVTDNDLVKNLDEYYTSGVYSVGMMLYVPTGNSAYYNVMTDFDVAYEWGFEVYFNVGGDGIVNGGATGAATFTYSFDTWMLTELVVDLDNDWAQYFLDGNLIHEWQWTLGAAGGGAQLQLAAVDFFGDAATTSYYFDDFVLDAVIEDLDPPENVVAEATGADVHVSWTAPGGGGTGELIELYQHDGTFSNAYYQAYDNGYGVVYDISAYPGCTLEFIDYRHSSWGIFGTWDYKIHVVDWDTFTEVYVTEVMQTTGDDQWEENIPLGALAGQSGLVGIFLEAMSNDAADAYPCLDADNSGPDGMSYFGELSDYSGFELSGVGDFLVDLWIMTAGDKITVKPPKVQITGTSNGISRNPGTLLTGTEYTMKQSENTTSVKSVSVLEGYNVSRDGTFLGYTTDTFYDDMGLANGTYEYCVTAVYDNGESDPVCDEATVNVTSNVIFFDDFEAYNAGEQLACQNPDDWTTWSNNPCSSEDAYVSDTYAYSGENSVNVVTDNDLVKNLDEYYTSGVYSVGFMLYVPTGNSAYYNVMTDFDVAYEWGFEVYFNVGGDGSVNGGATGAATFTYSFDTWMFTELVVDLDADWAQYYLDGTLIHEWQWTLGAAGGGAQLQLAAVDFFGDAATTSYYFDDFVLDEAPQGSSIVFEDDFEAYTVGEQLACQNPEDWTTWSNAPCGSEDAYISDDVAHSGENSAIIETGNDVVKVWDNYVSGKYLISFYMLVPDGFFGYFNTLQDFAGSGSQWGMQVYFDAGGAALVDAGGAGSATFNYSYDTWILNEVEVNLDDDWAKYIVDGTLIVEWQWSTGSFGTGTLNQLGGTNFYAWDVNGTPKFYFDDVVLEELSEPGEFPAPTDLAGEDIGCEVALTWDEPTGTPSGTFMYYNVFRNGEDIADATSESYNDTDVNSGTYQYYVTAVYDDGESQASNTVTVTVDCGGVFPPPENLEGPDLVFGGEDIVLTWDEPSISEEWIRWDAGENNGNGIGLTSGGTFSAASHWMPSELTEYDGQSLTKIAFWNNADPGATFSIKVWVGANASTLLVDQAVAVANPDEWTEVDLDSPVTIDASQELWFGYSVTHAGGTFPGGCDDGPAIQFSGDMISTDGNTWDSMSAAFGLDYNWNIGGFVTSAGDGSPAQPLVKDDVSLNATASYASALESGVASGNPVKFVPSYSKDLLSYNVYREGDVIGNTTETTYTDNVTVTGQYHYCVTAVYDNGESDCSNEILVDVVTGIEENLFNLTSVYPNPATDVVNIKSAYQIESVKVFNYNGQVVTNETVNSTMYKVNTSNFVSGLYFFQIETTEGTISKRVIIE